MKTKPFILIAVIVWQGFVPDLAMQQGRIVDTDDGWKVERLTTHIDALGDQSDIWVPAGATEAAIYKAALLSRGIKKVAKKKSLDEDF